MISTQRRFLSTLATPLTFMPKSLEETPLTMLVFPSLPVFTSMTSQAHQEWIMRSGMVTRWLSVMVTVKSLAVCSPFFTLISHANIFPGFTKNIDVIGHELTHGVIQHTADLEYEFQSGALNESLADVFGSMIKQYYHPDGK